MQPLKLRIGAIFAALALAVAACSSPDGTDTSQEPDPTTTTTTTTTMPDDSMEDMGNDSMDEDMGDDMTDDMDQQGEEAMMEDGPRTAASDLRATLTAGLQEHVYLAGIAVYTAVNQPEAFEAAAGALDLNSQDLAAAIASVYGDDAGNAFLELWRTHIGFFVDYTTARAAGDQAGQDTAMENLRGYREDFGAFLESANPNLTKEAVIEELQPHVTTVFAAIDAVVDGDADAFEDLKVAAGVMPNTAAVLAGAIAAQYPDTFPGDASSAGAELRATLTAGLQEHVYLAGIAVYTAVNQPEAFEAAAGALDLNSEDLAAAIASGYGDDAGNAFLELWRTHIGFFVDYTTARAAGDQAGQDTAMENLRGYREDFGAFLESANPNMTKEAVIEELQPHVTTVFAAIDAVVDGDADAFEDLKVAAGVMPNTAAVLAGAIAAQFDERF